MIFPIDFHFGSLIIPSHPVFEILSFFLGYRYYIYISKSKKYAPLSPEAEWWIVVGMVIGAFVFSRLIAALEDPDLFFHSTTWLYYIGGQTIAGGIAGGLLGVEIAKKILGIKRKTGDVFVFPLILGIIIGRIGCFLTGVKDGTVGLVSNLPWAFDQGDGLPRHPTSLYEIFFLILFWLILRSLQNKNYLKEGDLFAIFAFGYASFRLLEEFLKPRHVLWLGFSSIQLLCILLIVYYMQYFYRRYK